MRPNLVTQSFLTGSDIVHGRSAAVIPDGKATTGTSGKGIRRGCPQGKRVSWKRALGRTYHSK